MRMATDEIEENPFDFDVAYLEEKPFDFEVASPRIFL